MADKMLEVSLDGYYMLSERDTPDGKLLDCTIWSLDAMAEDDERSVIRDRYDGDDDSPGNWYGGVNHAGARELARQGWQDELQATADIADSAIQTVESHFVMPSFEPVHDVQGSQVDIGAYLSGEPECMIETPLIDVPKAGRIITICASTAASSGVDPDTIKRRGQVVTALALILARLGLACEIWADQTVSSWSPYQRARVRTLVKGANDVLDPARVLYALAHPSMLRRLTFGVEDGWKKRHNIPVAGGRGTPRDPIQDMPEGTIYLPCAMWGDKTSTVDGLIRHLKDLGLILGERDE